MDQDQKDNKTQKLKELEVEVKELMLDVRTIEKKIPDRLLRIKELEHETDKAKDHVVDLYANLRVLNNRVAVKIQEMKDVLDVFTGEYFAEIKK